MAIPPVNNSYSWTLPGVSNEPPPQALFGHRAACPIELDEEDRAPHSEWENAVAAAKRLDPFSVKSSLQRAFKDFTLFPSFEAWEEAIHPLLTTSSLSETQKTIFDSLLAFAILAFAIQSLPPSPLNTQTRLLDWIREKIPANSSYVGPESLAIATSQSAYLSQPLLSSLFEKCSLATKREILPKAIFIAIKASSFLGSLQGRVDPSRLKSFRDRIDPERFRGDKPPSRDVLKSIKELRALAKEHRIPIQNPLVLSSLHLTVTPRTHPSTDREILHYLLSWLGLPALPTLFASYFDPAYLEFSKTFRAAFSGGCLLARSDDIDRSLFLGSFTGREDLTLSDFLSLHFLDLLQCFHALEIHKHEVLKERYLSSEALSSFLTWGKESLWKGVIEKISPSIHRLLMTKDFQTPKQTARTKRKNSSHEDDPEILSISRIPRLKKRKADLPQGKSPEEIEACLTLSSIINAAPAKKTRAPAVSSAAFPFTKVETWRNGNCLPHAIALEFLRRGAVPDAIQEPARSALLQAINAESAAQLIPLIRDLGASAIESPDSDVSLIELLGAIFDEWKQELLHLSQPLLKFPLVSALVRNKILIFQERIEFYTETEKAAISSLYTAYQSAHAGHLPSGGPQTEVPLQDKITFFFNGWRQEAIPLFQKFSALSQELREKMFREEYDCNAYTTLERAQIWQAYVNHAKTDKAFTDIPFIKGLNAAGIPVEVLTQSPQGLAIVNHPAAPQPGYEKIFVYRPSDEHHYYGLREV